MNIIMNTVRNVEMDGIKKFWKELVNLILVLFLQEEKNMILSAILW